MPKTIFVSGATGTTGGATVRALRSRGIDVTIDQLREALAGYGMSEAVASATAQLLGHVATGTAAYVSPDIETVLGRPPRDFADWAQDNALAFR